MGRNIISKHANKQQKCFLWALSTFLTKEIKHSCCVRFIKATSCHPKRPVSETHSSLTLIYTVIKESFSTSVINLHNTGKFNNVFQFIFSHFTSLKSTFIPSSHLCPGVQSNIFPSHFPTKHLFSPLHTTYRDNIERRVCNKFLYVSDNDNLLKPVLAPFL